MFGDERAKVFRGIPGIQRSMVSSLPDTCDDYRPVHTYLPHNQEPLLSAGAGTMSGNEQVRRFSFFISLSQQCSQYTLSQCT